MESDLNCNIVSCGAVLTEEAITTVCSHGFCANCANQHGLLGRGSFACPACRKPLNEPRVCRQLLCPSEEWKSMVLCGLRPTVIMECAGRALGFWSYQLANQFHLQAMIAKNSQRNYELLEAEINNVYSEANTQINNLTSKIQAMEAEEQTLRRTCEELRLREEQSSKQLAVANQLYQKLKLQYTQGGSSPSLAHARQPAQLRRDVDPLPNPGPYGQRAPEPQFLVSGQERLERTKYFSAATAPYPRVQPSQGQFVGGAWNKPATTQYTPTRRLPTLNPRNSRHSLNPEQTVPSTGRSSSRFQAAPSPSTTQGMSNLGRIPEVPKPNFGRGPLEPGILGAPSGRSGHQRVDTLASQLGPRPPSRSYDPAHGSMHRH